jgi:hypothetical protein
MMVLLMAMLRAIFRQHDDLYQAVRVAGNK